MSRNPFLIRDEGEVVPLALALLKSAKGLFSVGSDHCMGWVWVRTGELGRRKTTEW